MTIKDTLTQQIIKDTINFQKDDALFYYYTTLFKTPPNILKLGDIDTVKLFDYLTELYNLTANNFLKTSHYDLKSKHYKLSEYFCPIEKEELILWADSYNELFIFYNPLRSDESLHKIADVIVKDFTARNKTKSEINLLTKNPELSFTKVELDNPQINLSQNYNNDLNEIDDLIIKQLQAENNKGIIMLHGKPGTGKSFYLKHLISCILNKPIIYITPDIAGNLGDPNFIQLLLDKRNSILIIEDAELLLTAREINQNNSAISTILNLSDGILADCLNIQIICTFNTDLENIDEALLRKGRLIAKYEFKELSLEKTNHLLQLQNSESKPSDKPLTLAEIFNYKLKDFSNLDSKSKIGFYKS